MTMTHNKLRHKLAISRHYKNAYSHEKQFKREREREGNEESQSVKNEKKKQKKIGTEENKIIENLKKKERRKNK